MIGTFLSSESGLSSGGTITGDLTISGDLTVQGDGLLTYDETVEGNLSLTKAVAGEFAGLYIINSALDAGTAPSVASIFGLGDTAGNYRQGGAIKVIKERTWTTSSSERDSAMTFWTSLNGTVAEKMRIDSDGNATMVGTLTINTGNADTVAGLHINASNGNPAFRVDTTALNESLSLGTDGNAQPTFKITTASSLVAMKVVNSNMIELRSTVDEYVRLKHRTEIFKDAFTDATCDTNSNTTVTHDSDDAHGSNKIEVGMQVMGAGGTGGIPAGAYVSAVVSNTQFTLSAAATSSLTNTTLTFTKPGHIVLKNPSTDIDRYNVIGQIDFQAPLEASGTDAILVGASIKAVAEADFSSSVNATALVFSTGTSDTASEKMRISSSANGGLSLLGDFPDINFKSGGESRLNFQAANGTQQSGIKNNAGTMKFYGSASGSGFRMILDANSRIFPSTGTSATSTIFGKLAGDDLEAGGIQNVFIGDNAGHTNRLGDDNIAIGFQAMDLSYIDDTEDALTIDNIFIGSLSGSGDWHDSGSYKNVAVGSGTMMAVLNDAHNNTALGYHALSSCTSGQYNVAIGSKASDNLNTGTHNVLIGYAVADALQTGTYNVALGSTALDAAAHGESYNIAIGGGALGGAKENVASGGGHLHTLDHNIAIGLDALHGSDLGTSDAILLHQGNIAIGSYALDATAANPHLGTIAIGHQALSALTSGGQNLAIGYNAMLLNTTGEHNVVIGYRALINGTGNSSNTVVGYEAMATASASGMISNTAIGWHAGNAINDANSDGNVLVGYDAGKGGAAAMIGCVAIGHNAMNATSTNAQTGTIAIGQSALTALTTGGGNTAVGYNVGLANQVGKYNTVFGYNAFITSNHIASDGSVAIGYDALRAKDPSSGSIYDDSSTAVGFQAGALESTGGKNTFIGFKAGDALTTGAKNVCIGDNAGGAIFDDIKNVFIGFEAGLASTANNVVAIGHQAMKGAAVQAGSVAIGDSALLSLTTGERNVAIGQNALMTVGGTSNNTSVGTYCLQTTTGSNNTALGYAALYGSSSGGSDNTVLGSQVGRFYGASGSNVVTGASQCTAVGSGVRFSDATPVGETAIGYGVVTTQSNETNIGVDNPVRQISKSVTCDLGGDIENDPAHATAIGMIPRYSVITKACVLITTLSSDSNHSLHLVLSTDSSGTDGTPLNNVQSLIGSTVECWSGQYANGNNANINVASGGINKVALAAQADGTDAGLSTIDTTVGSDANLYVYLAFADGSYGGGDTDPSTAPVVKVFIEYCGID